MNPFELLRPTSEEELVSILSKGDSVCIAGGTDLLPRIRRQGFAPLWLVDLSQVPDLNFIQKNDQEIVIGAMTTQAQVAASNLIQNLVPALAQAALSIGCPQTRNRATIGGNLINASPAADTLPPFLVLEASLRLVNISGWRDIALQDFLLGPGNTALLTNEYLHSVRFAIPGDNTKMIFSKLGKRNGMAIAIASIAVYLQLSDQHEISIARVAFGSLAPTGKRSPAVEQYLTGKVMTADVVCRAVDLLNDDIAPISDVRASEKYRRASARVLLRRALEALQNDKREMK